MADEIKDAEKNLGDSQLNLVTSYFSKIEERFEKMDHDQRGKLLDGLERLVKKIVYPIEISVPPYEKRVYDPEIARNVIDQTRLRYKKVAGELNISPATFSHLLKGDKNLTPSTALRKRFFKWFADRGYNPFAL